MNYKAPTPSPAEIIEQLQMILKSSHFCSRSKPSEILTLLVSEAIESRTLTEEQVRQKVFGSKHYNPLATNVRTNMVIVRQLLAKYYAQEGHADRIMISIPKRPKKQSASTNNTDAYRVLFAYSDFDVPLLNMANAYRNRWTPASIEMAINAYSSILNKHPHHIEAALGHIESLSIMGAFLSPPHPKKALLWFAHKTATKMLQEHPDDWRSHIAMATTTMCYHGDPIGCYLSLRKAHDLMPDLSLPGFLWLPIAFLFMGLEAQAFQCIDLLRKLRPDDSDVWIVLGFFDYIARKFDAAESSFGFAQLIDPTGWKPKAAMSILYLSTDRAELAMHTYQSMCRKLEGGSLPLPGIGLCAAFRTKKGTKGIAPDLRARITSFLHEAEDSRDHIQVAIAYMDRYPRRAIKALKKAVDHAQPLVFLLPFFPLFDSLKQYPEVQGLAASLKDTLNDGTAQLGEGEIAGWLIK